MSMLMMKAPPVPARPSRPPKPLQTDEFLGGCISRGTSLNSSCSFDEDDINDIDWNDRLRRVNTILHQDSVEIRKRCNSIPDLTADEKTNTVELSQHVTLVNKVNTGVGIPMRSNSPSSDEDIYELVDEENYRTNDSNCNLIKGGNFNTAPRQIDRTRIITRKHNISARMALENVLSDKCDPDLRFVRGDLIDEGASGKVFIGRDETTDAAVAIKIIDLSVQRKVGPIVKELQFLDNCTHRHMVNMVGSYMKNDNLWIVMEYIDGGCLTSFCKYMNLDEVVVATIAKQIVKGLSFLHGQKIIHRDIKSDNVLISTSGIIKLTDFGVSAQLRDDKKKRHTHVGTPYWMSPEIISLKPHTEKTDIWSLGILIIEMIQGLPPYMNDSPIDAMKKISRNGRPKLDKTIKISTELDKFLSGCLEKKPEKRLSTYQLQKETFLTDKSRSPEFLIPWINKCLSKIYED